jgi:hypothetical protein
MCYSRASDVPITPAHAAFMTSVHSVSSGHRLRGRVGVQSARENGLVKTTWVRKQLQERETAALVNRQRVDSQCARRETKWK